LDELKAAAPSGRSLALSECQHLLDHILGGEDE
jgi:hypothetical protein